MYNVQEAIQKYRPYKHPLNEQMKRLLEKTYSWTDWQQCWFEANLEQIGSKFYSTKRPVRAAVEQMVFDFNWIVEYHISANNFLPWIVSLL